MRPKTRVQLPAHCFSLALSMPSLLRFVRVHATAVTLVAIVGLAVLPRLSYIGRSQFLDFHAWRQADSAAFARGYLIDSFNPFEPSIDRQPCTLKHAAFGRVEAELPVVSYLAALPLRMLGMRDASAPYLRAVAVLVFACGCFALFACIRELGGDAIDGYLSVAAFGAAPLAIFFTRSPQPDGQSLSLAIATVWLLARYLNGGRMRDAFALGVVATALLLMKISNAYLGLVLVYMVLTQRGQRSILRDAPLWLAVFATCAAAGAWYWHAHSFGWSFGVWSEAPHDKKFTDLAFLSDLSHWQKLLARLSWDIFTVAGCLLAAIGFAVRTQARMMQVASVWLLSAAIFIVVTMNGQMRHVYYQLCLVPPVAIAAASGARFLFNRGLQGRVLLAGLLAVHAAITAFVLWGNSSSASIEGSSYFTQNLTLRPAIEAIQHFVPVDAPIVSTERDPRLYWNSRHRGYFSDSTNLSDILLCMDDTSDYLLLAARWRSRLTSKPTFSTTFQELWSDDFYTLYRRAPAH
jgi:hypothetical protein